MFTVLHVEHNRFYHVVLQNAIKDDNIKYVAAKSPREALEILAMAKIDLIVTGLVFENESGYDFLNTLIQGKYAKTPVIVLSSNDDEKLQRKLLDLGVIEYVNKNTSIDRVKMHLERIAHKRDTNERLRHAKVAVLDENELELQILSGIFSGNGIDAVEYFNDPLDFLMRTDGFDVCIVDFALPKISAEYVCSKIREKEKNSVVLALATVSDENDVTNIISSGVDDYIMKPISETMIYERLNHAMIQRGMKPGYGKHVSNAQDIDGVTGLYNRTYLLHKLENMMDKYRYGGDLAIILLNIDGTRHVNNIFGFEFGDEVISQVGMVISSLIRSTDVLGRFGGEEYLLILPDTELYGAATIAEKIRERIQKTDFGKKNLHVTVSGGVAEIDSDESIRLLEHAYSLMRKAKRTGKNRIEYDMLT